MDDFIVAEPNVVGFSEVELKNIELDLGLLLVNNSNKIDQEKWNEDKEAYMQAVAHKAVDMILKAASGLHKKDLDNVEVVELPAPRMTLPRAMPPPKKYKTKWEEYAAQKGIKKTKKEKKVWDEETQTWKPRFGAKSKNNDKEWMLEVPNSVAPTTDMFAKKKEEKKERVAKNEYQRLKNIASGQKAEASKLAPTKKDFYQAVVKAREATASMGKFDEVMKDEKNIKKLAVKRKLPADFGNLEKENDKILQVFKKIQKKRPKLDNEMAANIKIKETMDENRQNADKKKKKPNLSNISRHQKYGKLAKSHKKPKGKKAKAAAKHSH